jgi:hypothetical protein
MKEILLKENESIITISTLNNFQYYFVCDTENTTLKTILNILNDNYSFLKHGNNEEKVPNFYKYLSIYSEDLKMIIEEKNYDIIISKLNLPKNCDLRLRIKKIEENNVLTKDNGEKKEIKVEKIKEGNTKNNIIKKLKMK